MYRRLFVECDVSLKLLWSRKRHAQQSNLQVKPLHVADKLLSSSSFAMPVRLSSKWNSLGAAVPMAHEHLSQILLNGSRLGKSCL